MFRLEIDTDNAAFDRTGEVERILHSVARMFAAFDEPTNRSSEAQRAGTLRDINGNTVGKWEFVNGKAGRVR